MFRYRKVLFITVIILLFYYPKQVFAATNCCLGHDGIYACDTQTGQLYCRDGTVSNACSCQAPISPTPTPVPTLIPTQAPQVDSCPDNASINTTSDECVCNSGYVASDDACISNSDYCWNQYGGNSVYDEDSGSCTCSSGYVWNSSDTSCISFTSYCQNNLGSNSYYNNSNNTCSCDEGFEIQNNQCVVVTVQQPTTLENTSQPLVTSMPVLPTTAKTIESPTSTLKKSPVANKSTIKKNPLNKNPYKLHLKLSNFVTIPTSSQDNIQHFFQSIWNFIQGIFGSNSSSSDTLPSSKSTPINTSKYQLPLNYQQ
jgi:hypothetical protein